MKAKPLILVVALLFLVSAQAGSDASPQLNQKSKVTLLETGQFHGDEVTVTSGDTLLGLHVSNQGSLLLPYRLSVDAVHDPVIDHDETKKTGKSVSVDLPVQPTFLLKGANMLKEGAVVTVHQGQQTLAKTSPISLTLAGRHYELKVVGDEAEKCGEQLLPHEAKLVLAFGDTNQVLYSLEGCGNDAGWSLVWAGDLDGDDKLDLYVNVNQHYNVSERRLFLSSQSKNGQLVKEIAEFITTGC